MASNENDYPAHSRQFTTFDGDTARLEPDRIFDIARELRFAGLPPDAWFSGEGDFRLHFWKFTRAPWTWIATTESHPLPRPAVERFNERYKGFDMKAAAFNRIVITNPVTLKAFVELLRSVAAERQTAP